MTAADLVNMFLRLEMTGKEESSEIVFSDGTDSEQTPFFITGIGLDEDGDICLESDQSADVAMSPRQIAAELGRFDEGKTLYFIKIDSQGERELYNIKDGGTFDRHDPELRLISSSSLADALTSALCADGASRMTLTPESILRFESGTINFSVNSVYMDEEGCLCLESNEYDELDDYPVQMIIDELKSNPAPVYLRDDQAGEYYGIYPDELRVTPEGEVWIKAR